MKLFRNLAILVAVLAVLVGAYFIMDKYVKPASDTGENTTTAAEQIKVTDYMTDDIIKVTLVNADGTFVIEKQGTDWVLTSPAGLKTDSSKLSSIPVNLASIFADKIAAENITEDSLKDFGLNSPVELTFVVQDGTERTLQIGSMTPTKSGYYAKFKGEGTVYVIGEYSSGALLVRKSDLLDTTVLTLIADDIIKLSMDKKGVNFFKAYKDEEVSWVLTAPIKVNGNDESMSTITAALAGTTNYMELMDSNPATLETYGLANPAYTFEIGTSTADYKLLLGKEKVKGAEIYAMLEGSNEVFTINESAYTFLDKPLKEMIDSFVYIPTIGNLNRIDLTMDGKTTTFGLDIYKDAEGKSDNDKDKFNVDGVDVSTLMDKDENQIFRNFYKSLVGITLGGIEPEAVPAGTPEITITYYLKEAPGTVKVEYVSKDADNYYAIVDGVYTGLTVSKLKDDMGIVGMKASYGIIMDAVNAMKK